ncbi:MAG: GNAT family N-acetyltransferase, partial [Deltaproteobacteria bacterium]|nr:GNAT family N-acetyltransferase [Deltaproteobacteria bacterium]
RVEPLTETLAPAWDAFVRGHPAADHFHLAGWRDAIARSTGHEPHYLAALDGDRVRGVLPLFLLRTRVFGTLAVSLPFLNVCGIVADGPEARDALLAASGDFARANACRYVELRQRDPLGIDDLPVSSRKVTSVISLAGGADAVFARLHQNVRNKIRKAEKNDVVVTRGADGLADFYRVYSHNLRDLGTPVLSRRFFEEILRAFASDVHVYTARRHGALLGAKIVVRSPFTAFFIWAAAYRGALEFAPVQALNWAAIRDACDAGCAEIDLGRSTDGSSHQNFKKYWGVEIRPLHWTYQLVTATHMPGLNPDNPKFALA